MKKLSNLVAAASVAVAILIGTNVKAQTTTTADSPWRLGIGVEGGVPTGNVKNFSNFELGGTGRLQYDLTDKFDITLTSGYYSFLGKDIPGTSSKYTSLGVVPVKAGIKAFFAQDLYFGAEAGAGFETNGANKSTKLILSPALGWANQSWDVGVRYENFSGGNGPNYGTVALRVAYGFKL